jgi:hypothetical protein
MKCCTWLYQERGWRRQYEVLYLAASRDKLDAGGNTKSCIWLHQERGWRRQYEDELYLAAPRERLEAAI